MVALTFNAHDVEPSTGFDPLPTGKYPAIIVDSDEKPTKSGNGSYLQFEFEILDGQYKGRKLWVRLNTKNPSAKAVEIAKAEMSALCRAIGVMTPQDTVELHSIPIELTVRCKKNRDSGESENTITKYERLGTAGQSPQAATDASPWKR